MYYKVANRAAFAALAQAWATILLLAVTAFYAWEVSRTGNVPMVGVTGATCVKLLRDPRIQDYEGVSGYKFKCTIENTGSRPARNLRIRPIGKIGDVILPHTDFESVEKAITTDVILFPGVTVINQPGITKDVLDKVVLKGGRLVYTYELEYTDWDQARTYHHLQTFEVVVVKKDPLNLDVSLVAALAVTCFMGLEKRGASAVCCRQRVLPLVARSGNPPSASLSRAARRHPLPSDGPYNPDV